MSLCSEFCVLRFTLKERREGWTREAPFIFFLSFFLFYSFLFFFRCSRRTYRYSKLSPVTIPRMTGPFFGS